MDCRATGCLFASGKRERTRHDGPCTCLDTIRPKLRHAIHQRIIELKADLMDMSKDMDALKEDRDHYESLWVSSQDDP